MRECGLNAVAFRNSPSRSTNDLGPYGTESVCMSLTPTARDDPRMTPKTHHPTCPYGARGPDVDVRDEHDLQGKPDDEVAGHECE